MGFGQVLGKTLFITFLLLRGIQHHSNPASWSDKFLTKYKDFHTYHTSQPYIKSIPQEITQHLSPAKVTPFVNNYVKYLGYAELFLAACIFLDIPFLPLFGVLLLTIETIVLYNPFKGEINNDFYYCVVSFAIIGIALMMSFSPPKRQVRTDDSSSVASESQTSTSTAQAKKTAKERQSSADEKKEKKGKKAKRD